jgi:putative MFS transporter
MNSQEDQKFLSGALIIAALGYFVDVYDLILFAVVRITSLHSLGLEGKEVTSNGIYLLNVQMVGMLLGGVLWGVLGDRLGRKKALFGSILLYSAANIANAFIESVPQYALCRLFAGIGLAGELGAGVTLVAELLPRHLRGYGTTTIAAVGVLGAIVAGMTAELLTWRVSYFIGGLLGVALLAIRISVRESKLFDDAQKKKSKGILEILLTPRCMTKYVACVCVGLPIWFIIGLLVTLAPEITKALAAPVPPNVGIAVTCCYAGLFLGDISSGLLSQYLKSRKKALAVFLLFSILATVEFLTLTAPSLLELYTRYVVLGFSAGFWVLVVTTSAEQFGTNVRATVTTTVPNVIRGAVFPMTTAYALFTSSVGVSSAAMIVGMVVSGIATVSWFNLRETYHNDLDFTES